MADQFVFNPACIPYLRAGGAGVDEGIEDKGQEVLARAQANCPVRTGTLRDSLELEMTSDGGAVTARVGTGVEYAPYVEFGTSDTPAFAFLRRALDG